MRSASACVVHRTISDEFYRIAFGKKIYRSIDARGPNSMPVLSQICGMVISAPLVFPAAPRKRVMVRESETPAPRVVQVGDKSPELVTRRSLETGPDARKRGGVVLPGALPFETIENGGIPGMRISGLDIHHAIVDRINAVLVAGYNLYGATRVKW